MWQYCRLDNLPFADVGINFRNFNIMPTRLAPFLQMLLAWVPTRLAPFLQMLLAWVVNLSCSSTEMPRSFSSGFCTTSVLSILTFNSLFFYFEPKLMVWHLEKLPFKTFLSYHWDALFLSSIKICSTSLIVSAACDNFIDYRRHTWIMVSFSPGNANHFGIHSIRVVQRKILTGNPLFFHNTHWLSLDRFLPCTSFRKNMIVSNLVLHLKSHKKLSIWQSIMGNDVNQMLSTYHWREHLPISFHLNSVSILLCPFCWSDPTALFPFLRPTTPCYALVVFDVLLRNSFHYFS